MSWLLPIYISTGIFGLGVILIDIFGIFGHGQHDGDGSSDSDGDTDSSGDHDGDGSDDGSDDAGDGGYDHSADHDSSDHDSTDHEASNEHYSVIAHDGIKSVNPIFQLLFILRCFVYFSIGFGLVGFILTAFSKMNAASLIFSLPTGIITMIGAILLRRIQRSNLDSQVTMIELEASDAEVLVSIKKGQIGKVRVLYKGTYADRYAMASDAGREFKAGEKVKVTQVKDDILYIS